VTSSRSSWARYLARPGEGVGKQVQTEDLSRHRWQQGAQEGLTSTSRICDSPIEGVQAEAPDVGLAAATFFNGCHDGGRVVVADDEVGALSDSFGTAFTHPTPMSAPRSAGPSLTHSPVIATTWPDSCQAWIRTRLSAGLTRATTCRVSAVIPTNVETWAAVADGLLSQATSTPRIVARRHRSGRRRTKGILQLGSSWSCHHACRGVCWKG
jgi:hypothetical protein